MPLWLLPLVKQLGAWIATKRYYVAVCVMAFVVGWSCHGCKVKLIGDADDAPFIAPNGFGWIDDPAFVARTVGEFKTPYFGDAAKNLIQGAEDKDALLYNVYRRVHGHEWIPHNQGPVGSCVGHGASGGVEMLNAVEISQGAPAEPLDCSAATVYALSREVGGMLRSGDGSTGASAAKALMTLGSMSCKEAGDDNTDQSIGPPLCKKWGRSGVPDDKKPLALKHKVKTASQVRTPEEVRAAIVNGYPVTIASAVGFEGGGGFKRDADGFCKAGGSWPHQMFVGAYRADKKAFLVFQSWGKDQPPGPKSLGQPDGTFWISWKDMQRITSNGECYALSGYDGYKAQNIDVFIAAPASQRREYARVAPRFEIPFALAP